LVSKRIFVFTRQRTENRTDDGGRYTHYGDLWFTSRLCRSLRLTPPERGIVSRFCAPVRDLRTLKTTHCTAVVTPRTYTRDIDTDKKKLASRGQARSVIVIIIRYVWIPDALSSCGRRCSIDDEIDQFVICDSPTGRAAVSAFDATRTRDGFSNLRSGSRPPNAKNNTLHSRGHLPNVHARRRCGYKNNCVVNFHRKEYCWSYIFFSMLCKTKIPIFRCWLHCSRIKLVTVDDKDCIEIYTTHLIFL